MKKKNVILASMLLVITLLLGVGTVAYFRQNVNGNVSGNAGNLVLIVNEADAVLNETFTVSLNRSQTEPYVYPDDSGEFDININATGSTSDVEVTVSALRIDLPDNLKFYLDSEHTMELTTQKYVLSYSSSMTESFKVYWYWDGSVDDENDSLFMGKTIVANIEVSASAYKAPTLYKTLASKQSTLDTNVNFANTSSSTNGEGLMMMSSTQSDTYPILYYRGDVSDNNVIYGGFCWLIVRTTETGGVKLIYNGEVNEDGSCNNYSGVGGETANSNSEDAYIGAAYTAYGSPVYLGYMYNDDVEYSLSSATGRTNYKSHLADTSRLDSGTGRYTQNKTDSSLKIVIDEWYESNIDGKPAENLLEDTVWCNDRSISASEIDGYDDFLKAEYEVYLRVNQGTPTLVCAREVDRFTVSRDNGNGDLTYPIGLLTADEVLMTGGVVGGGNTNAITHLKTLLDFYTMSPLALFEEEPFLLQVYSGYMNNRFSGVVLDSFYYGVRPSVSLGLNAKVSGGDGSFAKPFLIS